MKANSEKVVINTKMVLKLASFLAIIAILLCYLLSFLDIINLKLPSFIILGILLLISTYNYFNKQK